ncbi:RNA polymerase sigma factor [Bacillus marinisedimentorum]|uniref:RNA polymerase sigma factor n=1 Tax=Bacillus marinisedimentorum TaxID=1821260 RepID=UPI000872EE44|nr:RNA polymerase sigma factor [Bacillus marinisedimentorum]
MNNFEGLYLQYKDEIYHFVLKYTNYDSYLAEDIIQETFLRAYTSLGQFEPYQIRKWLYTIARNIAIDHFRKKGRIILKESVFFNEICGTLTASEPEKGVIMKENTEEVLEKIYSLPEKQQEAVLLRDIYKLSYEEGAGVMGVKLNSYKTLLFRGRKAIRGNLLHSKRAG